MSGDYEHAGRVAKARKLADALRLRGTSAAEAATLSAPERNALARAAGIRVPSDLTWQYVVADVRLREMLTSIGTATNQEFTAL